MDLPLASLRCVAFLRACSPFLVVALVARRCRGLASMFEYTVLVCRKTIYSSLAQNFI